MDLSCFENKVVLVTGATGLIGSHLIEKLLSISGIRILALGRSKKKLESTFAPINNADIITYVEHEISIPLPNIGNVDYIFHAASPISGKIISTSPLDVINSNLNGTINCFEYLRAQGHGKMILFSSVTVYSNSSEIHVASEYMTNYAGYLDASNAPYAESKRMIEVIANAYHKQYGVDMLIARFSTVYGYSKNIPDSAFYEFIFKALKGEAITINHSGIPRRDNIYVEDAVNALLHLCQLGINGDVFNISSNGNGGNYASIDEIAKLIADSVNKLKKSNSVRVVYSEAVKDRPEGLKLSNEKIKSTGWNLTTSLEGGILETIKKYLADKVSG